MIKKNKRVEQECKTYNKNIFMIEHNYEEEIKVVLNIIGKDLENFS